MSGAQGYGTTCHFFFWEDEAKAPEARAQFKTLFLSRFFYPILERRVLKLSSPPEHRQGKLSCILQLRNTFTRFTQSLAVISCFLSLVWNSRRGILPRQQPLKTRIWTKSVTTGPRRQMGNLATRFLEFSYHLLLGFARPRKPMYQQT